MDEYPSARYVAQRVALASFGAFALQVLDMFMCFTDEVEYLWIGRVTPIKILYFCSRYFLLLAQGLNQYLTFILDENSSNSRLCLGTFIYKTTLAQTASTLLEIILLIRVYALYNQSKRAKWTLLCVFGVSTMLEVTGSTFVITSFIDVPGCIPRKANSKGVAFFGVGAVLAQVIIVAMTLFKIIMGRRVGWTRTPLTSLMLRQGLATFFFVLVLLVVVVGYAVVHEIDINMGNATLSWYIAMLSIAASRLILRMRKLVVIHREGRDEDGYDEDDETEVLFLTIISQ